MNTKISVTVTRDCWITTVLVLFCSAMTFLLVRSEYFPESSLFQQVPAQYVVAKVFRHAISSALKIEWKGESIGSFNMRVTPGSTTRVNSLLECEVPFLGRKSKMRLEAFCWLKSHRRVIRLFIRGRWQATAFELTASAATGRVVVEVIDDGKTIHREYAIRDFLQAGNGGKQVDIPDLLQGAPISQAQKFADNFASWRVHAWNTRIHRFDDWMDAYLLSARLDENWWFKLWISPTGELLKLDSSFGLRATNEDFFTPLSSGGNS